MDIFVIVIVVLLIVIVLMGVKSIPQGEEWTVERFGRYTRSLRPGLQLIVPVVESGVNRSLSLTGSTKLSVA